jgi:hypothetical protein
MNVLSISENEARLLIEDQLRENSHRKGKVCQWPVVGGSYVVGEDRTKKMGELAVRALLARAWFAENGPPGLPPLPLSYEEREALKNGSITHFLAWYARSLDGLNYDVERHPSFKKYVAGVLYAAEKGELVDLSFMDPAYVDELKNGFPPRELKGLGSGPSWKPPAEPKAKTRIAETRGRQQSRTA